MQVTKKPTVIEIITDVYVAVREEFKEYLPCQLDYDTSFQRIGIGTLMIIDEQGNGFIIALVPSGESYRFRVNMVRLPISNQANDIKDRLSVLLNLFIDKYGFDTEIQVCDMFK